MIKFTRIGFDSLHIFEACSVEAGSVKSRYGESWQGMDFRRANDDGHHKIVI